MTLLRRYVLWLILATIAGIVGALLVHHSLPVRYVSTAKVDVEPNVANLTIEFVPNIVTEQQVATSGIVLGNAAHTLGATPVALAKDLSATVAGTAATGGTANVLSISCTMPTAVGAQRCANAVAGAYVAYRNDVKQPIAVQKHDPLQVTLVTAATLPTAPTGPGKRILLPIGALLGLLLGIGAILVRDHLDHRVRGRADLERCLDAPVLAAIPVTRHARNVFLRRPLSRAAEAYRYLREHLNPPISMVPDGGALVLVTSPQARDGRTSVAANLAAALAEAGDGVILVDADLWHPSLSEVFDVSRRPGWSDLLAGRASLDEVAVPVADVPGLRLVTAGAAAPRRTEVFQEARLIRAFQDMRAQADVIVVDSAPVLVVSQAIALARVSDIVAVVADARRITREAVSAAVDQLRASGPKIMVGVLNGVRSRAKGQARSAPAHEPESLAPASGVPAILAGVVPPRGRNGQQQARSGAGHVYPGRSRDTEANGDDGPGSTEEPR
jgi:polysaccharide biosynthesis transport protein